MHAFFVSVKPRRTQYAPDKSSGHHRQKIEIVLNFIRELDPGKKEQTVER